MKKVTLFISVFLIGSACKKIDLEVIQKTDQCNPKDPVPYFEAIELTAYVVGTHQDSGRLRVRFSDTSQYSAQLKHFYPELIHELAGYNCCPCNLPVQFQKEGQKLRISGISRIERSSLEFYQNLVANPSNQPHDGDGCLPFEITKIEVIE